jgi:hypothetical protein
MGPIALATPLPQPLPKGGEQRARADIDGADRASYAPPPSPSQREGKKLTSGMRVEGIPVGNSTWNNSTTGLRPRLMKAAS